MMYKQLNAYDLFIECDGFYPLDVCKTLMDIYDNDEVEYDLSYMMNHIYNYQKDIYSLEEMFEEYDIIVNRTIDRYTIEEICEYLDCKFYETEKNYILIF